MIVISDTTPIISLLKVHHLDLLQKLFGTVKIPLTVYNELVIDDRFYDEIAVLNEYDFIEIDESIDIYAIKAFQNETGLDAGESAALILSKSLSADLLLIDEMNGRETAKKMNIQYTGTIGMIARAYKKSILSKNDVESIINGLQRAGRYISKNLYRMLIETIEE